MGAGVPQRALTVLDIDGVLADVRHRLRHLESRPKDWTGFFAAAARDPVLEEGALLAADLSREHDLLYLTGRPAHLHRTTESWLRRHRLPAGRLLMRPGGDFRPAKVVKLEILQSLSRTRSVELVVDDDPDVVATLRAAGYAVLHATWGGRSGPLHAAQERDGRT